MSIVHDPQVATAETLRLLRDSGSHPLMASFPRGAFFAFDHDLRYLSAGGLGLQDVGLSRELLEGRTIFEAFPGATARMIEPMYRAALHGNSTVWDIPYEGRIYSQRLAPVWGPDSTVVAGLGFTVDVTEDRRAEAALKASEERNRLTFEHAPIGEAIVDLDGTWRTVNAAVPRLLGYTAEELMTMTFQDVTHPDDLDLDLAHVDRLVGGEIASYEMEKRYITKNGRTVWVLLSASLVRDSAGNPLYFIAQIQDITENRRQREALQDLTAMLAHDLRNPATVIQGFAWLLTSEQDMDRDEVRSHACRIATSATALTNLLENALTASTLDAGELQPQPAACPIAETIMSSLAITGLESELDVTIDDAESAVIWADPVHLSQVFSNLLTNAHKYGGPNVSVAVSVCADDLARILVQDSGAGVEPEFVPHLFDRFSRSAGARRGPARGSGLGLYIVRDLLEINGGSIDYHSTGGAPGAAFDIRVPLAATG